MSWSLFKSGAADATLSFGECESAHAVLRQRFRPDLFGGENAALVIDDVDGDVERQGVGRKLDFDATVDEMTAVCEKVDWDKVDEKPSTHSKGIANMVAGLIGAGVIGFPMNFQFSGFFVGLLCITFVAILSHFGGVYIGMAGRLTGKSEINGMAYATCGKLGLFCSVYAFVGLTFLASVAYMVSWFGLLGAVAKDFNLLGDNPDAILSDQRILSYRTGVMSILMLVLSPLCLMRNQAKLAWVSSISIVVFLALIATL